MKAGLLWLPGPGPVLSALKVVGSHGCPWLLIGPLILFGVYAGIIHYDSLQNELWRLEQLDKS